MRIANGQARIRTEEAGHIEPLPALSFPVAGYAPDIFRMEAQADLPNAGELVDGNALADTREVRRG